MSDQEEPQPVDVHDKLDELTSMIESARAMPMSASCIVNRADVLALLDDLRELLPEEFRHAELLLQDREAIVEEGRRDARRILGEAQAERERLVSGTEVLSAAGSESEALRAQARADAARMRREVDDYVDAKLAGFEVVLDRTLAAVRRGREKLAGQQDLREADDGEPGAGWPTEHDEQDAYDREPHGLGWDGHAR